jgi:hypothetical protein
MPTITVRYTGPVPVTVPAYGLDLQPGQVFRVTLDEEGAARLLADPSGYWQRATEDEAVPEASPPKE